MSSKSLYLAVGALAGCLLASTAEAQRSQYPLYVEAKIGFMDLDVSGFDEAINLGVVLGYELYSHSAGMFSAEGEFTTTLSDGDTPGGGEWDVDTLAVFGVFRTSGNIYAKARAGFLDQDIKRAGGTGTIPDADDSGFAYGIGGGWRINPTSAVEVEYTAASDDLNFISAGYHMRF